MLKSFYTWIHRYERHLSALAMVAGFVADNFAFARVDLWQSQALLAAYTLACFIAIPLHHWFEARSVRGKWVPRWRMLLPMVTQFALGGFWSAFVIFYGRSAVFGASWPFLIFIFLIFLGSEYFHQYHARLVFTSILFFFAVYSCAIFEVPIYTGTMSTITFLESGALAIAVFAVFTTLLRIAAHDQFARDVWNIRLGAGVVLLVMHIFYFTSILPPLPLSAMASGVYHRVWHVPGAYLAESESEPWQVRFLGFAPTLHSVPGDLMYAYSSVFAPTALMTSISHEWQWQNPSTKKWETKAVVTYDIVGGRDGGYRGYSNMIMTDMGSWRVNIKTRDGRLIEQLPFTVVRSATPVATETLTLK